MTYGEIIEEHAPGVNLSSMAPRGSDDPARPFSRLPFGLELRLGRDADEMISETSMGHQGLALGHVTIDAATLRLHGARVLPPWLGFHLQTLGKHGRAQTLGKHGRARRGRMAMQAL